MFGQCHYGSWGSFGSFGLWNWVGLILQVIFWIGLAVGLILLIRAFLRTTQFSTAMAGQPSAEEILQARYAKGEITREQYQAMKQDLG